MKVVYLKSFLDDIKKIKDKKLKKKIKEFILEINELENIDQIQNIKKLKGYTIAYRARFGDYRLGIYMQTNGSIELARFVKRNDIYKFFPKKNIK